MRSIAILLLVFCVPGYPQKPPLNEGALFGDMPVVTAATLRTETLEEAPADVTVITASDIRMRGFRTLAEALATVRGFDVTYDRLYHYVGVHGFSLPGDYNTRFLVMLNGHPLTETVYGSNNFFGQDFGLDMGLVERIEVVRGPSAALYGSNAILATINVVTKSPADRAVSSASVETDSFGERKAAMSASVDLGRGANLLIAGSLFNNAGQPLNRIDPGSPASWPDGERGYHTFANLVWRDWAVTAYFNSREKEPVVGWDEEMLRDRRGAYLRDQRNFVTLARDVRVGASGKMRFSASYDQYRYNDRFFYPNDGDALDFRNTARSEWTTTRFTYERPTGRLGELTVGAEGTFELRNLQRNLTAYPSVTEQLHVSRPDRAGAIFVQQECRIARRWTTLVGLRLDATRNFGTSVSPRVALVFQPSAKTAYKVVYGRPFRNPTAYEQYFEDGIQYVANGNLRQETAQTYEVSVERKLRPQLSLIAAGYYIRLAGMIEATMTPDAYWQFRNLSAVAARGAEVELTGSLWQRVKAGASLSLQQAEERSSGRLPNSARAIAKANVAIPVVRTAVWVAADVQYLSSRLTVSGAPTPGVGLAHVTGTWRRPFGSACDLQAGVHNLANRRYVDPIALAEETMRQDGRSLFVRLVWDFGSR
jgi:outer membrane receptor for ferrienterochelin and colicins